MLTSFSLSTAFYWARQFNQPMSNWDVSKVGSMQSMLTGTSFNQTWCTETWENSVYKTYVKSWNLVNVAGLICCMQGEYLNGEECGKCAPGFYQNIEYTQINSCHRCSRDATSPLSGAINCSTCAEGKFSNDKRTECVECPSGYYQVDHTAHSNCTKCAVGRYQPDDGQYDCIDCKGGEYQNQEAKQFCILCSPGKFASSNSSSECSACEHGRYQPGVGMTDCVNITVGHEGIGGDTSLLNPGHMAQVSCPAGKYSSTYTCLVCPVDTYTSFAGSTSCEECQPGTYTNGENSSTVCAVCNAGEEMSGVGLSRMPCMRSWKDQCA